MRALVLNDTRRGAFSRHIGCAAVMEHLLHLCAINGIDVVRTFKEPERLDSQEFVDALHDTQIVIVNGEGTMHHDTRVALILARAIVFAKGHGHTTALVNAVWQANRVVNGCLQSLDYVCARDSHSAAQMREAGRREPDVAPDLSFYRMPGEAEPAPSDRRDAVLVIDSIDADLSQRLHAFASGRRLEFRVMQDWMQRTGGDALPFAGGAHVSHDELRSAGVVIAGRFHAVCLAMKYGVPFLTARSNTHKIEALLSDAGLPVDEFILPQGWEQLGTAELAGRAQQAHTRHAPTIAAFAQAANARIERSFADLTQKMKTELPDTSRQQATPRRLRKVRPGYFNTWARELEPAKSYVAKVPALDLAPLVANRNDPKLMRWARLDCDWYGENTRCFDAMRHESIDFLPAQVAGAYGVLDFARMPREPGEERWLITMGHQPQSLGANAGKVFGLLARLGVKHLFYAFDEASRHMPCFGEIAPFLDVLIHDESPLDAANAARLKPGCRTIHRSWVANIVPFSLPFNEAPEEKIMFLGSPLGLTEHRKRQIAYLQQRFKDKFVPSYDHSPAAGERVQLNRFKVALCPEGRKFVTPAMAKTHTDRPFWSGCVGMVVVSENSQAGGRLEELHQQELILRYDYDDLKQLEQQCERALAMSNAERRRIYDHFNRHETVGTVVAEAIAAVS